MKFVSGRIWALTKSERCIVPVRYASLDGSSCWRGGRHFQEEKMTIRKVGVVGCGLMGSGIAQVAAAAGFENVVGEVGSELVDKGIKGIEKNLNRLVEKGAIAEALKGEIRGRVEGPTFLDELNNCDLLIWAHIRP